MTLLLLMSGWMITGHAALAEEALGQIEEDYRTVALAKRVFGELHKKGDLEPEKVLLGNQLFHDPILSSNGQVSCASCHDLNAGGDSDTAFATGVSGNLTDRNAPTVYNLVGHTAYFWDGRAETLAAQIDGPVHHPDELNSNWPEIVSRIAEQQEYRTAFETVYGELPSEDTIKDAIVEFQQSLMTPDAPLDRFIAGDLQALSVKAKEGLNTFVELGCASCHQGNLIGANLMHEFGVFSAADSFEAIQRYKVPSLRNVVFTAPYFHDGHEESLEGAITKMARMQLGYELDKTETENIVAFLHGLSSDRVGARVNGGKRIAKAIN